MERHLECGVLAPERQERLVLRLGLWLTRKDTWGDLSCRQNERHDLSLQLQLRLIRHYPGKHLFLRRNGTSNNLPFRLRLVNRRESVLGNGSWVRSSRSRTH